MLTLSASSALLLVGCVSIALSLRQSLVGNRFLSLLTNVLYNTTLSDMETGYKAFRAEVVRSLDLRENDFTIEPEITAKVCKRKLRIYELPISYYGRTYAEGKKITWRDGFRALAVLASVRLGR